MWVCLNSAFFSIFEQPQPGSETLLVRARRKGDIEKVFPGAKVERTPGRDYLFRAMIDRELGAQAIADQVRQVSYPNFKDSVRDRKLHDVYARFWHGHASLQEIPPYSTRRNKRQGDLL